MDTPGNVSAFEYSSERLASLLPWPVHDANKYSRGKLVLVAGSAAYPGAACLAAYAAQRMGAGYVEVICAPESTAEVLSFRPSLVVRSWDGWSGNGEITQREGRPRACVVGPGFNASGNVEARLALCVVDEVEAPVLVDGGALSALATEGGLAAARKRLRSGRALVVTPHGGEAARMARGSGVDADCVPAVLAQRLARAYCCIVALKGPDTFVSDGEQVVVVRSGTPALAKAGTGDVLAGMIGALLAQGVGSLDAAVLGATLHAEAGRVAADRVTSICVVPEDVIEGIPQAIRLMG